MPRYVLITSTRDPAGTLLAQTLIQQYHFVRSEETFDATPLYHRDDFILVQAEKDLLFVDYLDTRFHPDAYIFLSRHQSESRQPTLTAHFTGNFTEDTSHGGRPKELAYSIPSLLKAYVQLLHRRRHQVPNYDVVIEATHHGPTALRRPLMFVEIGSTPAEWQDQQAASVVCDALLQTLTEPIKRSKVAIGFGGLHYSVKFTHSLVTTEYAFAAVAPKYALPHVTASTIEQMIEKSQEPVEAAMLEWKGLGTEKTRLIQLLALTPLEIIRI